MSVGAGGRGRWLGLAAVVTLLAVVVAGLVLDDDGGEQALDPSTTTTTRRRPTTSTAPPVTAPHGPVLPVPTGAALVLASSPSRWVHLDLDTGARTEVEVVDEGSVVGVRGGVVVTRGTRARYLPLPEGDPVELGEAGQVLPTDRTDEVWLIDGPSFGGFSDGSRDPDARDRARIVRIDGQERAPRVDLPGGYVAGSTARGLVIAAGGRVYLMGRDGDVQPLASGNVVGTSPGHVALEECDDQVRCRHVLVEVGTGRRHPLPLPARGPQFGGSVAISSDGLVASVAYGPGPPLVTIGSLDGGSIVTFEEPLLRFGPVWLPAGQGLLVVESPSAGISRLLLVDGRVERHPIAALAEDRGDYVIVIPE